MPLNICEETVKTAPVCAADFAHNAEILAAVQTYLCAALLTVKRINVNIVAGDTVEIPDVVTEANIIYVEIDGIKIDNLAEVIGAFMYWTIVPNGAASTLTFSAALANKNVKIGYLAL